MIIVICVLLAPVAIAMSVLPGTQKTSKLWYESFMKALAAYPLIMGMFAAGKIIAFGLTSGGEDASGFSQIAAIIAYFAPYALIPTALKAGGSALGKISGFAGDRSKGIFDRAKNWDANRKKFNKQLKDEKWAQRAGGTGFMARAAQAKMAAGAGMIPTSKRKMLRTRAAVASTASKAEQAEMGDASTLLDREYQRAVSDAIKNGREIPTNKDFFLDYAQSQQGGSASQKAALEQLVKIKAMKELTNFGAEAAGRGDAAAMDALKQTIGRNYGDVKGAAPHLANSTFERGASGGYEFKLDNNSLATASPEAASDWGGDTWEHVYKSPELRSDPRMQELAKSLRADPKLWNKLGRGDSSLPGPGEAGYDPAKDAKRLGANGIASMLAGPADSSSSGSGGSTPTGSTSSSDSPTPPTP